MNIIEYAYKNNRTFRESRFTEIDALMFAQLSYDKFEKVTSYLKSDWQNNYRVKDFYCAEFFEDMFCDAITDEDNQSLLTALAASRRYRDVKIRDITAINNSGQLAAKENDMQFAAMTFELDDQTIVVAFRGTDGSMIGWKEDFDLSAMDEIPSQKAAAKYIDRMFRRWGGLRGKKIYVAGHSKGGNLAVYGACMCAPEIRRNIAEVFSFDGPGFSKNTRGLIEQAIAEVPIKITRIIPDQSLVGILLSGYGECKVVKSNAFGIMQHASYSWEIVGESFKFLEKQSWGSAFADRTIESWLENATDEQRERILLTIFEILEENNLNSVNDLKNISATDVRNLAKEFKRVDTEVQHEMGEIFRGLISSAFSNIVKTPSEKPFGEKLFSEKHRETEPLEPKE